MFSLRVTWCHRDRCVTTPVLLFIIFAIQYQHAEGVPAQWNNVNLTDDSGYIVKPEFNNSFNGSVYLPFFNRTRGEVLLLSFPKFDLYSRYYWDDFSDENCNKVTNKYLENLSLDTLQRKEWLKCGYRDIPPRLFNESWVRLTYVSHYPHNRESAFNVTYSVLPQFEGAYQLPNGSFNCSAMEMRHVNLHFRCNMVIDCADREDELNCPYTSDKCPGMIDVGNFCLSSMPRNKNTITWEDAEAKCRKHNQILISLDSTEFTQTIRNLSEFYAENTSLVFHLGLRTTRNASRLQSLYDNMWEWSTNTTAFNVQTADFYYGSRTDLFPACFTFTFEFGFITVLCNKAIDARVVCQLSKESPNYTNTLPIPTLAINSPLRAFKVETVLCPSRHRVLNFLEHDPDSHCFNMSNMTCSETVNGLSFPLFRCHQSLNKCVHYSLVCDDFRDCPDGSDESFCACHRDTCNRSSCNSGQYSSDDRSCDDMLQRGGLAQLRFLGVFFPKSIDPPFIVDFQTDGRYNVTAQKNNCSDTHFRCSDDNCLPVYLRCNEVDDCKEHEDEATGCDVVKLCPGFFRCRGSNICLHPLHVCDEICQCPHGDDELMCDVKCPPGCYCRGLVFICSNSSVLNDTQSPHYLEISGTSISRVDLSTHCLRYLVVLRLSHCNMSELSHGYIPNLTELDLSSNELVSVKMDTLLQLKNLRILILSGNPLTELVAGSVKDQSTKLHTLDLSHTELSKYDGEPFKIFPNLNELNLSGSGIKNITSNAFDFTNELKILDMRGLKLEPYPSLLGLKYLAEVWADDFKACCRSSLPEGFQLSRCHAPGDKVASCDDLLRSELFRTAIWVMALCALVGNAGSCLARFLLRSESFHSGFSVFVTNLSLADFLMGVYLAIVGVADSLFRGRYAHQDRGWRTSAACQAAGFLSLLSSEVSAFFILLITVDRFLVLRFPFSRYHFRRRSALVASGVAWVTGVVLATVPLLPVTSQWHFYNQTGLCFSLPFAREKRSDGYTYSFSVVILLNFVLFLLIAAGQVAIYLSVRANSMSSDNTTARSKEAVIARRLLAVVVSDFLCWFPIGVLGVVALLGIHIPPDISVYVAIFVLPFNSALNPFLYTLNVVREKRRKAAKARMVEQLQSELRQTAITHSSLSAMRHLTTWLKDGVLSPQKVATLLEGKEMAKELVSLWLEKEARYPQEQIRSWLKEGMVSTRQLAAETQDEEIVQELMSEWLKREALSPRKQINSWLREGRVSPHDLATVTQSQGMTQTVIKAWIANGNLFLQDYIDPCLEQGRVSPQDSATVEQSQAGQVSIMLDKRQISPQEPNVRSLEQGRVFAQDLARLTKTKVTAKDQVSIWLRDGLLSPIELTNLVQTQQAVMDQPEEEVKEGIFSDVDRTTLICQSDFDECEKIVVRM